MAAGSVVRVIRAPGRVVVDPTDLSTTHPYGGTEVGKTTLCVLQPIGGPQFKVMSEGLGEVTDVLEASKQWVFSCFVRGWDDDAVEKFFSVHRSAGAVSQHSTFSEPGTSTPGESALDRELVVLFVPDDLIHVPSVLVYRGIPDWTEGAELLFQRGEELGIPVALTCIRDTNDNMLSVGRFSDLSLT